MSAGDIVAIVIVCALLSVALGVIICDKVKGKTDCDSCSFRTECKHTKCDGMCAHCSACNKKKMSVGERNRSTAKIAEARRGEGEAAGENRL